MVRVGCVPGHHDAEGGSGQPGTERGLWARVVSPGLWPPSVEPGGIVLSYETYALVRDLVRAHPLPPITMKGISREVVPYAVDGLLSELPQRPQVISEHAKGLDLFIDLDVIDERAAARARQRLEELLAALEGQQPKPA